MALPAFLLEHCFHRELPYNTVPQSNDSYLPTAALRAVTDPSPGCRTQVWCDRDHGHGSYLSERSLQEQGLLAQPRGLNTITQVKWASRNWFLCSSAVLDQRSDSNTLETFPIPLKVKGWTRWSLRLHPTWCSVILAEHLAQCWWVI